MQIRPVQIRPNLTISPVRPTARPDAPRAPQRVKPSTQDVARPQTAAATPAQPPRIVPRGSFVNIRV